MSRAISARRERPSRRPGFGLLRQAGPDTAFLVSFTRRFGLPACLLAVLLLACATLVPTQAQAADPVWSATMTVGYGTGGNSGRGYNSYITDGGTLDVGTFTAENTNNSTDTFTVRGLFVGTSSAAGSLVFWMDPSTQAVGLKDSSQYTLEFAGETIPLGSTSTNNIGNNIQSIVFPNSWLTANASSLNLANHETTLPLGAEVKVCLRLTTDTDACSGDTTASNDATLSSLTVVDGDSNAVSLDPTFASDTDTYTADVANSVDEVTFTATPATGATVTSVTLGGTAISDTVFTDGISVPSLPVGANVIVITVTAEDAATTEDYTVTVTRAAAANVAPVFADETLTRSIAENTAANSNVGAVIPAATDGNGDNLTYTMEGTDESSFNFNTTTRQITTKTGVTYDFEADSSYQVTIKADDSKGGTDTVTVNISLTNADEPPLGPAAPMVSATTGTTDSLTVQWSAPTNTGRPGIDHYDLQYRKGTSGSWTLEESIDGTSATIPSLESGESYQVRVRAVNAEGDGAWSTPGSGSTQGAIPTASIAAASAVEGQAVRFTVTLSSGTSASVSVAWTASVGSGDTATLSASAPGGADFTTTSGTVSFTANQTTKTFDVPTTNDTVDEPNETFTVTLSSPSNATLSTTAATAAGTITDNDDTPEVTLVLDPASISENAGVSTVTATLDRASSEETTVTVSAAAGNNAETDDFTVSSNKELTIAAGQTTSSGTVTITAVNSTASEGAKSVTVTGEAENDQGIEQPAAETLTITDAQSESTEVTLSVSPAEISEGSGGTVTVTATLNGAAQSTAIPITVSVAGGSATAVTDFATVNDITVTIEADATSGSNTFTLSPVDDAIDEPDETVTVTGPATVSGLTVKPAGGASVKIADDDDTPKVTLVLGSDEISEKGGSTIVTATLDRASSQATTVTVLASAGADTVAGDFTQTGSSLTIAAGATSSQGTVRIAANDNSIHTDDKSVTVSATATNPLASANNDLAALQPASETLTIEEDDTKSTEVTLETSLDKVPESATTGALVTVTATLDEAARPEATNVAVTVTGDTATAATDFAAVTNFTVTIAAGATSGTGTFTLAPVNDTIDEPDETVRVNGSVTVSDLSVVPADGVEVEITDNDATPHVTLVLTPDSITEKGGVSTVTATLDRASSVATTVTVSAAPGDDTDTGDFNVSSNKALTIAAGATSSQGVVTITGVDNTLDDTEDKSVTVSGTAANQLASDNNDLETLQPDDETLEISDDEAGSTEVTLTVSPAAVAEDATGDAQKVTVTAMLNGAARATAVPVSVSVGAGTADVGDDFGAVSNFTVTIQPNATSASGEFRLIPNNDMIDEPNETVIVTGSTTVSGLSVKPSGGVSVEITDNDDTPKVTLVLSAASISEKDGETTVTATLDRASSRDTIVTVGTTPGTGTDTDDYTQTGSTITIDAGETSSSDTVTIAAKNNDIDDADRSLTVSASVANDHGITAPDTVPLAITDDEETSTMVALTVSPIEVSEGATTDAQKTVRVTGRLDAAAREEDATVTLSVTAGTAEAGTDYGAVGSVTLTIDAEATEGSADIVLPLINDRIDEPDETIFVTGAIHSSTMGPSLSVDQPAGGNTVTIKDDDNAPVVTLTLSPDKIPEKDGSSIVTATLDRPSTQDTVVTVSATPVSPADTNDFSVSSDKVITIDAGETTSSDTVTITAVNNDIDHANREVEVSGSVVNSQGFSGPAMETLTIEDEEETSTMVTLTVAPVEVSESATGDDRIVKVTGTLDAAARDADATVTLKVTAGTATAGTDYGTVTDVTLTIEAEDTSGTADILIPLLTDTTDEPDETIRVNGTTGTAGLSVVQPAGGLTVTIKDDDDAPEVTLVLDPDSISENGGVSTVEAILNRASSQATTVTVSAAPGDDTEAGDFSVSSNKVLTIAAGQTTSSGVVTITGVDNTVDDTEDRSVTVTASAVNSQGIEQPDAETLEITDDEASSTEVLLTVSPAGVAENATGNARTVTVTATLNGAPRATQVPVTVSVAGDTATATTDFAPVSDFMVTIEANATSASNTFTLIPVDDNIDEPDETLAITGSTTATGLTVEPSGGATVNITDNDATPHVTLVLDPASISEDDASTTVTATLDRASSQATTVTVETAPGDADTVAGDFTQTGTMLSIAAGQTTSSGTVTIAANDNEIYTGDKSVTVSATAVNQLASDNNDVAALQPDAETLAIEDDDTKSTEVTLEVSPAAVSEAATGNAQTVTVTATLDEAARPEATDVAVTVAGDTAIAGTDFAAVTDFTVTIAAGATSGSNTFTLAPVNDTVDEPDETVRVNGSVTVSDLAVVPSGGVEVEITDNDPTPHVTLVLSTDSIREDGGSTIVTATLDRASSQPTTVTVSANPVAPADTDDFTQTGATITIAAGETTSSDTVTIAAKDNVIDHDNREVTVSASAANQLASANNDLAALQPDAEMLTITDNEATSEVVTLTVTDLTGQNAIDEGGSATVTVTATLDAAAREQDAVVLVKVLGSDGGNSLNPSATADAGDDFAEVTDFTVTIPAEETSGSATFTLTTLDDEIAERVETIVITGAIDSTTEGPGLEVSPDDDIIDSPLLHIQIADDDPDPVATLVLSPDTISENGGVSTVTATLDRPSGSAIQIQLVTTPGDDTETGDYSLSSSSLLIPAGSTSSIGDPRNNLQPVTITAVNDDPPVEGNHKTVTVAGTVSGERIVQPDPQTLTITDDDTPSTAVILTVSPDRVAENATGGDRTITVTATLDGAFRGTATDVTVSVGGGTAVAGTDYTAVEDFTITIPAMAVEGEMTFTLAPANDETDAPDRTLRVTGSTSASGLTVGPAGGLEVTIADDDLSPVVTLVLDQETISEEGGVSTVEATLDRPSSARITIDVTAAPVPPAEADDFTQSGTRLTIAAGATTSTGIVRITAVDNDVADDDRDISVSGIADTDGPGVEQPEPKTLEIEDNDDESRTVTLSLSPDEVSEGATGNARIVTVNAELDGAARPADVAVAITVAGGSAVEGEDFAAVSPFTVTIPEGQRSGSREFTLLPFNDVIDEPDETVLVRGALGTGSSGLGLAADSLTLTLKDDEPEPKLSLVLTPDSIREDGGSTIVTATLDIASPEETVITVSAAPVAPAADGDFELSGNTELRIAPNERTSTGTVTITANDNEVDEPQNKKVTVSATAVNDLGVGDPDEETLTIADNDQASTTATLSVSPSSVQEGSTETITVTAELDGAARTVDTVITVSVGTGTASASDFTPVNNVTLTIPAEEKTGTAEFELATIQDETDEPDETVRVTGRTTGLRLAPSGGVTVTIGNDDPDPRVTLVLTPATISENGGRSTVTAILDRASSAATTLTISAAPGNDTEAGDFRLGGSRLTIPAGRTESTGTVTISGVNNTVFNTLPRSATVSGAAENAEGVAQPQAATLAITDDDQPSTEVILTVSPDRVAENGGARRLTVTGTLDGAPEAADTVVTLTVNAGAAEAAEATLTIPEGRRSATTALTLTPDDNDVDEPDREVAVNAAFTSRSSDSQLTDVNPSSLTVTVTDDDERGVTVSVEKLTVREGEDGAATYTVVLGSAPISTVTVTPSTQSQPADANVTVSPASLSFTPTDWREPKMVTVTAADDENVEEDAVFDITHTVGGGDYGTNNVTAAPVTVTVLGFEESPDGMVKLKPPSTGDRTVTVPEGTDVPAGLRVTIPQAQDADAILTVMIAEETPGTMPQGFRAGDAVVDINLADGSELAGEAVVCLPGRGRVFRYDEETSEWVKLEPPAGGSPPGLACGVTDSFSLFALGAAPFAEVVKSWTVRFGRTVADQVVSAVESRFASAPKAGAEISVAGRRIPIAGPAPKNDRAADAGKNEKARARQESMSAQLRDGARPGTDFETGFETDRDRPRRSGGSTVSNRQLLTGTSFSMTAENEDGGGEFVSVWGRGAVTRFSGGGNARGLDGEVASYMAGADWKRASRSKSGAGAWTAGLMVAQSRGTGSFKGETEGKIKSNLTGFYPYGRYALNNRIALWGVAGYGEGKLKLKPEGDTEEIKTDLALGMAAAGLRGVIVEAPKEGGPEVAVKTDALYVRTTTAAVSEEDLEAKEGAVTRLRLGLEGTWRGIEAGGGEMTPRLELGLRLDGGDAETGYGADIGGGMAWESRESGLRAKLSGRGLLTHESAGFREMGVAGSLTWDPDRASDRGPSLTLRQTAGAEAAGGMDALLRRDTPAGLAANDNDNDDDNGFGNRRLEMKLGYGMPAFGDRFTSTPELGVGLSDGGRRDYRLGWRLGLVPRGRLSSFGLGLEATRTEPANDAGSRAEPDHGVRFKLDARF